MQNLSAIDAVMNDTYLKKSLSNISNIRNGTYIKLVKLCTQVTQVVEEEDTLSSLAGRHRCKWVGKVSDGNCRLDSCDAIPQIFSIVFEGNKVLNRRNEFNAAQSAMCKACITHIFNFLYFYDPSIMMIVLSMVKNLYFCKFSDMG
jgi:hypothetical protein